MSYPRRKGTWKPVKRSLRASQRRFRTYKRGTPRPKHSMYYSLGRRGYRH